MTIHISPEIARAAYELLRTTPPFHRWNLPSADEIHFICRPMKTDVGACSMEGRVPKMYVATNALGTLDSLEKLLAHEMCHIRQWNLGNRRGAHHGADFAKLADQVCRYHGWDRHAF